MILKTNSTVVNLKDAQNKVDTASEGLAQVESSPSECSRRQSTSTSAINYTNAQISNIALPPPSPNLELYFTAGPNSMNGTNLCYSQNSIGPEGSSANLERADSKYLTPPEVNQSIAIDPQMEGVHHKSKNLLMGRNSSLEKIHSISDRTARYAVVLYDHMSSNNKELSIQEGDVISILEFPSTPDNGWIMARLGDREGYVPASYVKYEAI